jgi:hypothetical protein
MGWTGRVYHKLTRRQTEKTCNLDRPSNRIQYRIWNPIGAWVWTYVQVSALSLCQLELRPFKCLKGFIVSEQTSNPDKPDDVIRGNRLYKSHFSHNIPGQSKS